MPDRIYEGEVHGRFGDKILFSERYKDFSDITDSEEVNMILPHRSKLLLYDIELKEFEEIRVFTSFDSVPNISKHPDKAVFVSSHPGYKTIFTNENPLKPFEIEDIQNKKCECFIFDFNDCKLTKFYESVDPPSNMSVSNHRIVYNTNAYQPELEKTFLYDFESMKTKKIFAGSFSPQWMDFNIVHTKDEIYFLEGFEWGSPMNLYRIFE